MHPHTHARTHTHTHTVSLVLRLTTNKVNRLLSYLHCYTLLDTSEARIIKIRSIVAMVMWTVSVSET